MEYFDVEKVERLENFVFEIFPRYVALGIIVPFLLAVVVIFSPFYLLGVLLEKIFGRKE